MFGLFKKRLDWDWYIQNACHMINLDDAQFNKILLDLDYNDLNSPEYLFAKYKYRLITIYYVISAVGMKSEKVNDDEYSIFQERLKGLAVLGNPNDLFSVADYPVDDIGLDTILPFIQKIEGGMQSYHDLCLKSVSQHVASSTQGGAGTNDEVGQNLISLYLSCFDSLLEIDNLDEEKENSLLMYIQGSYRSQTAFAKKLIDA